jgi:hypothetical protein
MSQTKQTSKRKRRRKTIPLLGAAGLSLSLAGGISAAAAHQAVEPAAGSVKTIHATRIAEEEIADISLATFYVTDRENTVGVLRRTQLAFGSGGGCGCSGCGGCWTGTYYNHSVIGDDPPPHSVKPPRPHNSKRAKTNQGN